MLWQISDIVTGGKPMLNGLIKNKCCQRMACDLLHTSAETVPSGGACLGKQYKWTFPGWEAWMNSRPRKKFHVLTIPSATQASLSMLIYEHPVLITLPRILWPTLSDQKPRYQFQWFGLKDDSVFGINTCFSLFCAHRTYRRMLPILICIFWLLYLNKRLSFFSYCSASSHLPWSYLTSSSLLPALLLHNIINSHPQTCKTVKRKESFMLLLHSIWSPPTWSLGAQFLS